MLEVRQTKPLDPGTLNKMYTRTGYLFCMEKKALGTTWVKCYCSYIRENRLFCMIPYNQTTGKITNTESFKVKSCLRKTSESTDKRFCFELIPEDRPSTVIFTMQAQSEDDRLLWLEALDGREPNKYSHSPGGKPSSAEESYLDEAGFTFMQECLATLDKRGLEEEGLYRVVGVASKVTKLLNSGLDRRKLEKLNLDQVETKTLTSAIKTFLRNLPEPLMSFSLHQKFIEAAKYDSYSSRLGEVHRLVHLLPPVNRKMLQLILSHLMAVANKDDKNLMTVSNLGVCFGPTLLRAEEETVAAIMDIKFANVVVEILISNWETILKTKPGFTAPPKPAHSHSSSPHPSLTSPYAGGINTASPHSHLPVFSSPSQNQQQQQQHPAYNQIHQHANQMHVATLNTTPTGQSSSSQSQTSPSGRPVPPYIPPPTPSNQPNQLQQYVSTTSLASTPGGGMVGHPTLTTAVIKDGPKLHHQSMTTTPGSGSNTPAYATWERTLKGGNNSHSLLQQQYATHPHQQLSSSSGVSSGSLSGSLANLPPHRSPAPASSMSSLNTSGSNLHTPNTSAMSPHQQQLQVSNTPQQQQQAPWYNRNNPGRHLQPKQPPTTSPQGGGGGHDQLLMSSTTPTKPLSRQLSGASGISTSGGGSLAGSTTTTDTRGGHLSEYETSTTHRSSSSSTDSLASNSSREGTLDNYGVVGPRGVPGMQPAELRKVKTLYACVGEHETELSFEPNQIITNVRPSLEPGWLEGNLNGKIGLVPENYVEYVP